MSSSTNPQQTQQHGRVQDDDCIDLSTPLRAACPKTRLANIPEWVIERTYKGLGRTVSPDDDDETIRDCLTHVWLRVSSALEEDPELEGHLAEKNEFLNNVWRKGEQKFIDSLKAMAKSNTWSGLLEDEVFFVNTALVKATERAWDQTYRGDNATMLLEIISSSLDECRRQSYSKQNCIVNSSGTGKSRMVDQLAMEIITVPMCLRPYTSKGFPPADVALRSWMLSEVYDPGLVQKRLYAFLYSLLTVTRTTLETIESQSEKTYDSEVTETEKGVISRQAKLASSFRDHMTKGQSIKGPNAYRENFYNKVIESANEYLAVPFGARPLEGLGGEAKRLSKFVDPHRKLDRQTGPRRPLVIFAFDEAQLLSDNPAGVQWNLFTELRRHLRQISRYPTIFSLFLSTAGRFSVIAPDVRSDPSSRVRDVSIPSLDPITEVSFDDLAYAARENTVTLDRVVQVDWMSHLGRPLFGSIWDAMDDKNEKLLMDLAKEKLLGGRAVLHKDDQSGSLGCLSVRFALQINMIDILSTQVEHHMRLYLSATSQWDRLVTITGSEPLIAEAAYELMNETQLNPVQYLANHSDLDCVDRGLRGELVAALLIMQAHDAARAASSGNRWVSVDAFMKELLPPSKYQVLHESLPTFWRDGEKVSFVEAFRGYGIWFNHVIRVEDKELFSSNHLWKFVTRGAMVLSSIHHDGVDIVLPVCDTKRKLSRDTVTAILVQVKNSDEYELDVDEMLFDWMSPIKFVFPDDMTPKPVIRIVMALGSREAGVTFPEVGQREPHHADPFTAFDVWLAGLSTAAFKNIDEDLASYRILLKRSLRRNAAFEFSDDSEDEMKHGRGSIRLRMAALSRTKDA